jgi:hypothetical protein
MSRVFWRLLQKESNGEEVQGMCQILEVMAMDMFSPKMGGLPTVELALLDLS